MTVGPQYQSQLALLAGALGHGLDSSTGLQLYQQTIAAADAARQQRQQEIQQTLGQLAQLATTSATQGATPDQVQSLVQATKAGLPMAQTQAVRHGVHGILSNLADYQATPDPMAQAQLQGQLLQNAQAQADLQGGGTLDPSQETVYGPAHQQEVAQLTQQYLSQGMSVPDVRQTILTQLVPQLAPATDVPITGPDGTPTGQTTKGPPPSAGPISAAINRDISATVAQVEPQWAAQNLAAYAPQGTSSPPANPAQPTLAHSALVGALNNTDWGANFSTGGGTATSDWPAYLQNVLGWVNSASKAGLV